MFALCIVYNLQRVDQSMIFASIAQLETSHLYTYTPFHGMICTQCAFFQSGNWVLVQGNDSVCTQFHELPPLSIAECPQCSFSLLFSPAGYRVLVQGNDSVRTQFHEGMHKWDRQCNAFWSCVHLLEQRKVPRNVGGYLPPQSCWRALAELRLKFTIHSNRPEMDDVYWINLQMTGWCSNQESFVENIFGPIQVNYLWRKRPIV